MKIDIASIGKVLAGLAAILALFAANIEVVELRDLILTGAAFLGAVAAYISIHYTKKNL